MVFKGPAVKKNVRCLGVIDHSKSLIPFMWSHNVLNTFVVVQIRYES